MNKTVQITKVYHRSHGFGKQLKAYRIEENNWDILLPSHLFENAQEALEFYHENRKQKEEQKHDAWFNS